MASDALKQQTPSRLDRVRQGGIQTFPHQGEQRIVSIERLVENPHNERRNYRNMEGLVQTVRSVGILEPLIVEPIDGQRYMIIVGHRRFRAARVAGLEKVPIMIGEAEKDSVRRRKSIISNVQREDVGPVEMAEGLQALLDEDDEIKTQRDLARVIGKREPWVSDMLRILTMPPSLLEKLRSTEVSVPYDSMIRIARVGGEQHQRQLIDAVLSGATQREIRDQIDRLKGKIAGPSSLQKATKPRTVYAEARAWVIIQSNTPKTLTAEEELGVLRSVIRIVERKLK